MVCSTCAADWCGVVDIGPNRIRRGCRNTPSYQSAFCSTCTKNLSTVKNPPEVDKGERVNFLAELFRLKYLNPKEYFVEAITDSRMKNNQSEVKIK